MAYASHFPLPACADLLKWKEGWQEACAVHISKGRFVQALFFADISAAIMYPWKLSILDNGWN